jgi:LPXTG-motif cell wall-anchored protein
VEAESAPAPSGSLPFTGGDVAGLAAIGTAAIGAGALMIRRSRKAA